MTYLFKASVIIAVFYLLYLLFFKRETFFQHNRWFLITGLFVALMFPLVSIPVEIPVETFNYPVTEQFVTVTEMETAAVAMSEPFDWSALLTAIYLIGLSIFLIQFLLQFGSLALLLLKNPKKRDGFYTYVIIKSKVAPFSFFKWIVFNPKSYEKEELQLILEHEKVHVNQLHSFDIIMTQLVSAVFWFNPFMWFYKKDIKQNLEYIADNVVQQKSNNNKQYQRLLLKTSIAHHNMPLVNNFYNSLIKKRIIMLQKSKSRSQKKWRMALILPILTVLLFSMNREEIYIEANAIDKASKKQNLEMSVSRDAMANSMTVVSEPLNENNNKLKQRKAQVANKKPKKVLSKKAEKPVLGISQPKAQIKNEAQKNTRPLKTVLPAFSFANANMAYEENYSKKIEFKITKNSTDADLENVKQKLKAEGLEAKIKGVKRNKKGEITAIKIDVKGETSNTNYRISSDDGIEPISIVYDTDSGNIVIGNKKASDANTFVYKTEGKVKFKKGSGNNVYVFSSDDEDEEDTEVIFEQVGKSGKVKIIEGDNIEIITEDDEDVIVEDLKNVVKGKYVYRVITEDDNNDIEIMIDDIGNKTIHEEVIVNGDKIKVVKGKVKKNKWVNDDDETRIIMRKDSNFKIVGGGDKKPLIVIDGKIYTKSELKDLDPKKIESVTVVKGKKAIEKYGDKGKDGVIEITTKKE